MTAQYFAIEAYRHTHQSPRTLQHTAKRLRMPYIRGQPELGGEVAGLEGSVQIMRHSGESRCHGRARRTIKGMWYVHYLYSTSLITV
jgi:hypothetical protein